MRFSKASVLLILMILSAIFLQHDKSSFLYIIGNMSSLLALVLVINILLVSEAIPKWLAVVLIALLVTLRLLISRSPELILPVYEWFYLVIFFICGLQLHAKSIEKLEKLFVWACLLNLPIMLIQLFGGDAWFHFTRTDFHGDSLETFVPKMVLFVKDYLPLTTVQARPSGFFASNNFFSMFLLCALSLRLRDLGCLKWNTSDFLIALVVVVTFSKTVFLSLILFLLYCFICGLRPHRLYAVKISLSLTLFFSLYYLLMPGLFAYQIDVDNAYLNLAIRAYSLFDMLDMKTVSNIFAESAPKAFSTEQSEFTGLMKIVVTITNNAVSGVVAVFLLIIAIMLLRKIIRNVRTINKKRIVTSSQIFGAQLIKGRNVPFLILAPTLMGLSFVTSPILWLVFGSLLSPSRFKAQLGNNLDPPAPRNHLL